MSSILDKCVGAPCERFAPGTVLLSEGQTSGRLYVLAEGSVKVLRGDTQVAVVGEAGSVFGEMSVLLSRPHTATVRAASPVMEEMIFAKAQGAIVHQRGVPEGGFAGRRFRVRECRELPQV